MVEGLVPVPLVRIYFLVMTSSSERVSIPEAARAESETGQHAEAFALLVAISAERCNEDSWALEALDARMLGRSREDAAFKHAVIDIVTEWVSSRAPQNRAFTAYEVAGQLAEESLLEDDEIVKISVAFHNRR
jgi:hypothetical protein